MLYKTNAAGGQPAARTTDAGRASISADHYNTPASGFLLCDALPYGRLVC
jgi:hypothetical protein